MRTLVFDNVSFELSDEAFDAFQKLKKDNELALSENQANLDSLKKEKSELSAKLDSQEIEMNSLKKEIEELKAKDNTEDLKKLLDVYEMYNSKGFVIRQNNELVSLDSLENKLLQAYLGDNYQSLLNNKDTAYKKAMIDIALEKYQDINKNLLPNCKTNDNAQEVTIHPIEKFLEDSNKGE